MSVTEETSESAAQKDFFDVLFVGLFCFKKRDRVAVMPDGREPDDETIAPHIPCLVVDPGCVNEEETSGWEDNDPELTDDGIYTFGKCTVDITKATTRGDLDATQHDENVFNLVKADKSYRFAGAAAKTITEIPIGQGTLELFRRPNLDATVSRLRVPHDGDIFVTVTVEGEDQPRVLALKPGTDFAIANSTLEFDPDKTGDAFLLFGRIARSRRITPPARFQPPRVPVIPGHYHVFRIGRPIGEGSGTGGGTGCCPPP
jgi:hypothetical protein